MGVHGNSFFSLGYSLECLLSFQPDFVKLLFGILKRLLGSLHIEPWIDACWESLISSPHLERFSGMGSYKFNMFCLKPSWWKKAGVDLLALISLGHIPRDVREMFRKNLRCLYWWFPLRCSQDKGPPLCVSDPLECRLEFEWDVSMTSLPAWSQSFSRHIAPY